MGIEIRGMTPLNATLRVIYRVVQKQKQVVVLDIRHGARRKLKPISCSLSVSILKSGDPRLDMAAKSH